MIQRAVIIAALIMVTPGSLINTTRVTNGLAPLALSSHLSSIAQNHAQNMADSGGIFHSTNLADAVGSGWERIGEIVGSGASVTSIHQAFLSSPSHLSVILGTYTHYGEGVVVAEGITYVAVVFVKYKVITTTTTAPPAVTTTMVRPTPITTIPSPTTVVIAALEVAIVPIVPDRPVVQICDPFKVTLELCVD